MKNVPAILLVAAFVSALLASVNTPVPRINLVGLALTFWLASLIWAGR